MGSISGILKHLPEADAGDEEACKYAMQLVSLSVLPMALTAAIELRLLELIAAAGDGAKLSSEELAKRIGATNPLAPIMIDRILRLLAAYSILTFSATTDAEGRQVLSYGAAPVCKYLTPNEDGVSMAAFCLSTHEHASMESWYYVKDAVMNGGMPYQKANGGLTVFENHAKNPRLSKLFNEAMKGLSFITMNKILDSYTGFRSVKTVVDVGGGTGGSLSLIIAKNPHIKGINFDLPHVIAQAPAIQGVKHIGGDMFQTNDIPEGDAIFMKSILHDWNDEDCVKVLKKCWKALPEKGKVVIVDFILPETPDPSSTALSAYHADIIMLLESPGGKSRTEKEYEGLGMSSGFSGFTSLLCFPNLGVMEFIK